MNREIQTLHNHCIEQIKIAVANEQIHHAQQSGECWDTGKKLAYGDIARRLVGMGARLKENKQ